MGALSTSKFKLAPSPRCPDCAVKMLPYRCDGSVLFKCGRCHGMWLPNRKIGVFRSALAKFNLADLEVYVDPLDEGKYSISACRNCHMVLDEFHYAYNTGVSVYRCARCQGLWLPVRELIHLVHSVKLGQSLREDVRGFLIEFRKLYEGIF